mmetsp:Transcript_30900/g.49583  ORF Transcript_30900/g.49583 Transcript_30900/m.49583 type:complete len:758 (+) Transcript_30900:333-2606(+)|eukprot:CAMPEP_0203748394 /NCGR_PEP_ID=MMETSP0098-20131031/3286_1 /ASSEMBLY_ACC=CAM_ASM_000208 /TAXON_ID=96639 /ORGANISM=" , Strain NY0313808BC1" /LENGTH=757 /DNA_ID=CAMNT_0050637121 /DNA_START=262 /DNA_END=2535 /DNA_ORIENTATION=+
MLSLPVLQNKIKRTPTSYVAEFRQQLRSFDAQLSIFELSPPKDSKEFGRLVTFLSHVAHLYPKDSSHFAESVLHLLDKSYEAMDGDLRKTLFQALVLLRNRGELDGITLLTLCFNLFRCKDKTLRELLYSYIITDIRNVNKKATNMKLNKSIQNVVFGMLEDPSSIAAKKSLHVMVDLYKRRVWVDARTVNVIGDACLSKQPKNVAIALQFFLGIDEKIDALEDEEEDETLEESLEASTGKKRSQLERAAKASARNFSKKTRARKRRQEKDEKALKKFRQTKQNSEGKRHSAPRYPAIELLNDPQGFSEKLFKKLRSSNEHFEVRLMMMNLISRVIGHHKLLVLPFYSFLQKYLQPHQRHVTNILAYLIQSSHDLVPAEDLEPIMKHIANNFVSDRSGPEVMAVGLNSVRELVTKVPLLTNGEGMDDLIQDLVQYKKYKRDKSVVIAARSLLNLLREINPAALARRDRGKFHNATEKLLEYGQTKVAEGVDGAELLQYLEEEAKVLGGDDEDEEEDEGSEEEDNDEMEQEDEGDEQEEKETDVSGETLLEKAKKRKIAQTDRIDAKRLLTEEDFSRIKKLKAKLEKEKRDPKARRKNEKKKKAMNTRNALLKKLEKEGYEIENAEQAENGMLEESDDDPFASDVSSGDEGDDGTVDPFSLEGVVKRRRQALVERLSSVYEGRRGAHQLVSNRAGGTSNTEKDKNKNFLMVQKSRKVRNKAFVSFRQQQQQLKKHVRTMEKTQKTVQKVRRRSNKTRS